MSPRLRFAVAPTIVTGTQALTIGGVRHKCDISRSLNGNRQRSLVTRAIAADSSWQNLAALGNEFLEPVGVFVVDKVHFVGAEPAGFSSSRWRVLH